MALRPSTRPASAVSLNARASLTARARLHHHLTSPVVTEHVRPAMPAQRLIIKFGGTSVGSGQAIASAAGIAADLRRAGHPVAVVTSAMSGVTDALLGGAAAAVRGERVHVRELAETLRAKHRAAATELGLTGGERAAVLDPIDGRLTEFAMLCDALAVLGDASPRALDAVSSLGERMSVHLLAGALRM